jgi:glycosyltransferase involved in cell wall biosynthesis
LTFDIGIDGVSIEIAKYARILESYYGRLEESGIHFIAGEFLPPADTILKPHWSRFQIEGINGWSKWDEGIWFDALYFEDMPGRGLRSAELAAEIYSQARMIGDKLGEYLTANEIALLIPVNVASNPGNFALTLALVLVTEALGTAVLNINHDYYWDGGKPPAKRGPEEVPGNRDHFFRNVENQPFFSLFQMLYPWNGRRWLQVNINKTQSKRLIHNYGFPKERVFEISTSVSDKLFKDYSTTDVASARQRMAYILSNGDPMIRPRSLAEHKSQLSKWMGSQVPVVIGAREGLILDVTAEDVLYLLQPTRVIARKRIERGVELLEALLQGPMAEVFEKNDARQLVLHISGPTPLEHQADLEIVMNTYGDLIVNLPGHIADRVFLAFSSGQETHDSFEEHYFADLNIAVIYRMATAILFPSEIEGRGLPIIESAAVGIPIICSRYRPEQVFADVVGEDLPRDLQIRYLLFPEGELTDDFLRDVVDTITDPETSGQWISHNRKAVRRRYSTDALKMAFSELLDHAYKICAEVE